MLDPFMGAGTTALVAKRLNRHFLGFELVDKYVGIAQERIKSVQKELL
ncbi:MAG: DNA methyltransferase [Chloroflexota bacterium]